MGGINRIKDCNEGQKLDLYQLWDLVLNVD